MEEQPPATARPECPGGSNIALDPFCDDCRTPSHVSKSDLQTLDSIERAAATLFTRVRASIASRLESTPASSPGDALGAFPYYGGDELRGGVGRRDSRASTETVSSSEVAAIGSVPQHPVSDSTFLNDLPVPASCLQYSRPNVYKGFLGRRKLNRAPCHGVSFQAQNDDSLEDSSGDDTEEGPQITDGGLDPEKVREMILDMPPSEPIPIIDPIVAVIYDGTRRAWKSVRPTSGLSVQKSVLREYANLIKTPPHSIETQKPLVNIILPVPETRSKGGVADIFPRIIAQVGGSTAEEDLSDQTVITLPANSLWWIIHDLGDMLNLELDPASRTAAYPRAALNQRGASRSQGGNARSSVAARSISTRDVSSAESFKTANELGEDDEILALPTEALRTIETTSPSTSVVHNHDGGPARSRGKCEQRTEKDPYLEAETKALGAARDLHCVGDFELICRESQPPHNVCPAHRLSHSSVGIIPLEEHLKALERQKDTDFAGRELHIQIEEPCGSDRYTGGWDWSLRKKRIAAAIACLIPGFVGFVMGCYFGEAAAIQKSLQVSGNIVALGNVGFLAGVALSGLVFWPLPLLHGRKPYSLVSLALVVPLQFPQALSLPPHTTLRQQVGAPMLPYVVCLLVFRSLSGIIIGFAGLTSLATILDMFGPDTGVCCRGGVVFNNGIPVEGVDKYHLVPGGEAGARVGVWLGVWAWFFVASPGVGFFIGQIIAEKFDPAWGFWVTAIADTVLLFAAATIPEVRPPWRRLVGGERLSGWVRSGVERGELALVIFGKPPERWWKEVWAGIKMTGRICGQAGFLILAVYTAWVVGQVTMIMSLLVRLIFSNYRFKSIDVGLAVLALPTASLFSIPFQLSTFYLPDFRHLSRRAAHLTGTHSSMGQHRYRGSLFFSTLLLPIASLGFTISATSPSTHFMIPVAFAAAAFFSGTLAFAEGHLILWDNWDVSDLPATRIGQSGTVSNGASPGGRPHGTSRPVTLQDSGDAGFVTSHPEITAGMAVLHSLSLMLAALGVGVSGLLEQTVGVRNGVAIWVGVGFLLEAGLVTILWRGRRQKVLVPGEGVTSERWCFVGLLQRGKWTRWSAVGGRWGDEIGD